jgi:hypothetical protein
MFTETKTLLASRGVWGGIIALLAFVAGMLGFTFSDVDQRQLIDLIVPLQAGIGGVLAIIGRVWATKRIV